MSRCSRVSNKLLLLLYGSITFPSFNMLFFRHHLPEILFFLPLYILYETNITWGPLYYFHILSHMQNVNHAYVFVVSRMLQLNEEIGAFPPLLLTSGSIALTYPVRWTYNKHEGVSMNRRIVIVYQVETDDRTIWAVQMDRHYILPCISMT